MTWYLVKHRGNFTFAFTLFVKTDSWCILAVRFPMTGNYNGHSICRSTLLAVSVHNATAWSVSTLRDSLLNPYYECTRSHYASVGSTWVSQLVKRRQPVPIKEIQRAISDLKAPLRLSCDYSDKI